MEAAAGVSHYGDCGGHRGLCCREEEGSCKDVSYVEGAGCGQVAAGVGVY